MDKQEFNDFLADLTTRFPGVGAWLDGLGGPHRKRMLDQWYDEQICSISHADSKAALAAIAAGDAYKWKEYERDRIPMFVRQAASQEAYERMVAERAGVGLEDEPTYKCPNCCDSGWVNFKDSKDRPMQAPCSCEKGKDLHELRHDPTSVVGKYRRARGFMMVDPSAQRRTSEAKKIWQ